METKLCILAVRHGDRPRGRYFSTLILSRCFAWTVL
jgi:hypothetical protein